MHELHSVEQTLPFQPQSKKTSRTLYSWFGSEKQKCAILLLSLPASCMVAKRPITEGPPSSSDLDLDSPTPAADSKKLKLEMATQMEDLMNRLSSLEARQVQMQEEMKNIAQNMADLTSTVSGMPQRAEMTYLQAAAVEWSNKATTSVAELTKASAEQTQDIHGMKNEMMQAGDALRLEFGLLRSRVTDIENERRTEANAHDAR